MRPEVPRLLLVCRDTVKPPATLQDDADLFDWIDDDRAAGQDCRDKLGRVRELLAP